jgi:3-oxoacyl-[acyl-carrier-protein] synthase II
MADTPNKPVWLARSETVTALGADTATLWSALLEGRSAIGPVRDFSVSEIPYKRAAQTGLSLSALIERVASPFGPLPRDPFIIWTGVKSNIGWIEGDRSEPPPLAVDRLAETARHIGASGRGMAINAACASSSTGIALGCALIAGGRERFVFVCGADTAGRFSHIGFSALKGLSEQPARPFDAARDGLTLGDGAVGILLCGDRDLDLVAGDAPVRVSGWGLANDANHITGPARDGRGLAAAIRAALAAGRCGPEAVAAFCAHGTGTVYNDAMENAACHSVFGGRLLPAFSIKGAVGHTLGAAGGIEAAVSAFCLKNRIIPPTAGFRSGDPGSCLAVSSAAAAIGSGPLLTTNSGFGGVNAALLLGGPA